MSLCKVLQFVVCSCMGQGQLKKSFFFLFPVQTMMKIAKYNVFTNFVAV